MNQPFRFKQFTIYQDRCAMKVGTDGVLLGAWTSVNKSHNSILDIGAGTGLIALMLAQRSDAELLDAIEIDSSAYEQCVENFENSPWGDRLFCYHASLDEFTQEIEEKYDLIVSNPPFYTAEYKSNTTARDLARFEDALPFSHLLACVSKLLSNNGCFTAIISYEERERFIGIAKINGLYLSRICNVRGNENSPIKRSLLEFTFQESKTETEELVIETERHNYTSRYSELTKNFYLKF